MNTYKVIVNGTNFLIQTKGETKRMGFYATRFIEADNDRQAQQIAMSMIDQDQKLRQAIRNSPDSPPIIQIDQILELQITENEKNSNNNYMFYPDED